MAAANGKLHIVVFPWLAFGHMIPFLELSKAIAKRGHHIYFISTPRNIQRLPKVPDDLSHSIDFTALPLPDVEGLPADAEATFDIPQKDVEYLKIAFDGLEQPFSKFIKEADPKPDWIVHDFAHYWISQIAAEAGVPTVFFSAYMSSSIVFAGPVSEEPSRTTPEQLSVPPPWVPFSSNLCYRLHEARRLFNDSFTTNKSSITDVARWNVTIRGCKAVAVRTCMEMEPKWLNLCPQVLGKPVIPVGLLPPQPSEQKKGGDDYIIEWLDKKGPRSVLYVAFGSEATLSVELLCELALGIELAKIPFIWAYRKVLPEGFEERTKEYGIVAKGWVPQLDILGHDSIGGVLMHSGWGSVIESLQFGHPLALITVFADHGINARVLTERGFAIEVERDENDGYFTKEAVAKAIVLVMVEDEGKPIRNKAKELKNVFTDIDSQGLYVDSFVQYLQNNGEQGN